MVEMANWVVAREGAGWDEARGVHWMVKATSQELTDVLGAEDVVGEAADMVKAVEKAAQEVVDMV